MFIGGDPDFIIIYNLISRIYENASENPITEEHGRKKLKVKFTFYLIRVQF